VRAVGKRLRPLSGVDKCFVGDGKDKRKGEIEYIGKRSEANKGLSHRGDGAIQEKMNQRACGWCAQSTGVPLGSAFRQSAAKN